MDKFGNSTWKVNTLERDSICGCTYDSCWLYQWLPIFKSNSSLSQLPLCSVIADMWKVPWYTENKKLKKARGKFYFFSLIFPSFLYLSNLPFPTLAALVSLWEHSAISFPKTHLLATLDTALFFSSYISSESNLWC